MLRILVIADALIPTGFARVADAILKRLSGRFEFHQLGISYFGPTVDRPWKIYPVPAGENTYPFEESERLMAELDPDIVFIINDIWIVNVFAERLKKLDPQVTIVSYSPVDTDPVEPEIIIPLFLHVDHVVTYTQYARSQILTAASNAKAQTGVAISKAVSIIPHGIDNDVFHPIGPAPGDFKAGRLLARKALYHDRPELHDAFIVLNANRNQPRKRIDLTIELFAIFARDKPDNVKLHLHMARRDIAGWDIYVMARRFGVLDRLIVTTPNNQIPAVSPRVLNMIYNSAEVGLNTCTAEGWGLVAFEHAAAGGAQLLPDHTTQSELWSGAAMLMPPRFVITTERSLGNAYFISPEEGAEMLDSLYADPDLLDRVATACRTRATLPELSWDPIAERWARLFLSASEAEQLEYESSVRDFSPR